MAANNIKEAAAHIQNTSHDTDKVCSYWHLTCSITKKNYKNCAKRLNLLIKNYNTNDNNNFVKSVAYIICHLSNCFLKMISTN